MILYVCTYVLSQMALFKGHQNPRGNRNRQSNQNWSEIISAKEQKNETPWSKFKLKYRVALWAGVKEIFFRKICNINTHTQHKWCEKLGRNPHWSIVMAIICMYICVCYPVWDKATCHDPLMVGSNHPELLMKTFKLSVSAKNQLSVGHGFRIKIVAIDHSIR